MALAAFSGQEPVPSAFRTEVSIQTASAGVYVLSARVADLDSGKILAVPSLKVPANEEASAESTIPGGVISFTGKIDPAVHSATYSIQVKRGAKVISEHSAGVALQ
ncbi:MAG TPA: hypothetical protein VNW71_14350 [Thermoanaerobaculia bacterium]|nr:hypothetical protein [Thermoanaerobaculia bacterium]